MIIFIENHDLLYSSQYGFCKRRSTQHAILDIVNAIPTNVSQRLLSCGVFIDLKKAFDTVNRHILLNKLNHYGFRRIVNDWFSSYQVGQHSHIRQSHHPSSAVEFPKGQFLAHCFFCYMLMISTNAQRNSSFTFLLMTLTFFTLTKMWRPLKSHLMPNYKNFMIGWQPISWLSTLKNQIL